MESTNTNITYLANEITNYLDDIFIYNDEKEDNQSINIVMQMLNSISIDVDNSYTDIYEIYMEYNNILNDFKYEIKIDPVLKLLSDRIEFDIINRMLKIFLDELSTIESNLDLEPMFKISEKYNYVLDMFSQKIEENDTLKTLSNRIREKIDFSIVSYSDLYNRKQKRNRRKGTTVKSELFNSNKQISTTNIKEVDFNKIVSISMQLRKLLNNLKKICRDQCNTPCGLLVDAKSDNTPCGLLVDAKSCNTPCGLLVDAKSCNTKLYSSNENEYISAIKNNSKLSSSSDSENEDNEFAFKNEDNEFTFKNEDSEFTLTNISNEVIFGNESDKSNIDDIYEEYHIIQSTQKELITSNIRLSMLASEIEYYFEIYSVKAK